MSAADTFAPLIGDVATKLLGAPDHMIGAGKELRWRTRGSFKVDVADGVWHDHEAKEGGGVLDLVMRERGCDKAGALDWLEGEGLIEPRESEAARTFYDYRDERGEVLSRVERRPKGSMPRFVQHGPDGKGGFACRKGCMQGVRRVPYRLPELLAADRSAIVYVCEGEKDADRLSKAGLAATSNAEGAGKFRAELAAHFSGRRVVLLEDNDKAGRDHVADVATKLRGMAANIAVLRLPGLPEKGDVSDWLNADGTIGQLAEMAERALSQPAPLEEQPCAGPKPAYLRGISAAALMAKQFEPVNYVVPGLLAEGVTILASKPKLGKSWLCLDIALAIASGRAVFGKIPVTQGDVLYAALEDSERRLKSRLLKKGVRQAPERLTLATEWPGLDDGCIAEMEAWADAVERPSLVIVDVLKMVRGVTRQNESIYDSDYRALTGLATFARRRGISVLIVHHTRKMDADDPLETLSGTNGLSGAADTIMVLKRELGTGHCLLYVRGRDVEESEKAVRFEPDTATWELLGAAEEIGRTNERQAILDVLRKHAKPLSVRDISDLLAKNYDATRKTLVRMWDAGEVLKEGRGLYTCPQCPNVRNNDEPDNRTHRTGYSEGDEVVQAFAPEYEQDGWIGESPSHTTDRLRGAG